ncbi:MAG: homoserine kinase [Deltaproteobacteria bacterium]|nr:homoserine kinase [Deltaproteobacteria bacterium]
MTRQRPSRDLPRLRLREFAPAGETNTYRVFVPATIGNVGPGFDVLGLAIDGLGDEVSVELIDGGQIVIREVSGRDAEVIPTDPAANSASIAAKAMLQGAGRANQGLAICIHRALPACGGLGASAASAVGGAVATALALGLSDEPLAMMEAALAGESAVAGHHLDNIAPALFGGLTLVRSVEDRDIVAIPTPTTWWAATVTPNTRIRTRDARAVLPATSPESAWVAQMAQTAALVAAFALADEQLVARALIDHYAEPRRKHLIPHFDAAQRSALEAGALGASISGAGPTVFALAPDEATARACESAMADAFRGEISGRHSGPIAQRGVRPTL